jgi:hypothetical protein
MKKQMTLPAGLAVGGGQGTGFSGIRFTRWLALSLVPLVLSAMGCRNEGFPPERTLIVRTEQTPLLDAPGVHGRELHLLPRSTPLLDLGEVSRFATRLHFGDTLIESPWLRVQTPAGDTGWVFAAAAPPPAPEAFAEWFLQKRLLCFFGPALTTRRNEWAGELTQAGSDAALAPAYRHGLSLRDTLALFLNRRAEPNEPALQPDFFWLNQALPGFIVQQVGPAAQPYPFVDFRVWLEKAASTPGGQDDAFLQVCLQAFPADSIESPYPIWTIQTGESSGSSQLGLGRHLAMLQNLDEAMATGPLFQPELVKIKDALVEDMVGKNTTYWQPVEKILTELNKILESNFSSLDERDRLALQERLLMLENAEANGITVNLRSGE